MSVFKCSKFLKNLSQVNRLAVRFDSCCPKQQCGQPSTKDLLLKRMSCCERHSNKKITVVGAGQVGVSCVICCYMRIYDEIGACELNIGNVLEVSLEGQEGVEQVNICDKIVIYDKNKDKALGEMYDYLHGSAVMKLPKVVNCCDYTKTKDSDVILVTAGVPQKKGQSRLDLIDTNCKVFKEIIPPLAKQSPNAVFVILSNPCDILSYATWKYSGFPPNRIVSTGTDLDSSRFKVLISQRLGVSPNTVHGWIIGEHGDSSVPIWSSVNVAGVRLLDLNPKMGQSCDPENWADIHKQVVKCGALVQSLKVYTNWAVGIVAANIAEDVLMNNYRLHAVSTCAQDFYGITSDIFMSLPCIIGGDGVQSVVLQNLTCEEIQMLTKSACTLDKVKNSIKL